MIAVDGCAQKAWPPAAERRKKRFAGTTELKENTRMAAGRLRAFECSDFLYTQASTLGAHQGELNMAISTKFRTLACSLGAAVCCLSLAIAQDGLDAAAGTALERGAAALQQEDFETARREFTEAIAGAQLTDPRGYIGRAQAHVGLELYEDALKDFKAALDRTNSPSPEMQALRGEVLYRRGRMYLDLGGQNLSAAVPDLQAAYETNRDNLDYAFALGKLYALISPNSPGAGAEAEPLLTKFLEANPDDAEALRLRGQAYASMSDMDKALADMNRSIELESDNHEGYFALAIIYLREEEYQKSVDALERSIETYEPEDEEDDMPYSQGYLTKAIAHEELGKQAEDAEEKKAQLQASIDTCDKLLELLPDKPEAAGTKFTTLFRKGISQRLLSQYGPAVASLTEAIELNPEYGEAYFRRAICFAEMGEEGLALRDLQATQALNFEDARAYLWEGITYAQMGKYRDAIRSYNESISYSNRYLDAYLNRGHAYYQLGEFQSAIDSFNECIRLQTSEPSYYYKRGLCYEQMSETEPAVRSYMNAIQMNEAFAPAYDQLIPLLQSSGREALAGQYRAKRSNLP